MEQRCDGFIVRNQAGEAVIIIYVIFPILIRFSIFFQWLSLLFSKEVYCTLPKKIKNRLNDELGNRATVSSAPFSFDTIINGTSAIPSVPVSSAAAEGSNR